jgi:DNA-binding NarL/FixJ family response regulator
LIGREAPLQAINAWYAAVQAGDPTPRVLLIRGEAGVGKSRLAATVRDQAARRGRHILAVAATEADQSQPLGVLVELLHAICPAFPPDEIAATLGPAAPIVARLLPELSPLLAVNTAAHVAELPQQQRLFFSGLAALCTRLAARQPVLIVMEDAHWSDAASLAGLHYLARTLRAHPIGLIVTARETAPTHPFTGMLADLGRERAIHELALAPLSRDELALMVQLMLRLSYPAPSEFVSALYTLTDGNPLFVEEVLSALLVAGHLQPEQGQLTTPDDLPIPPNLRAAVQRHAAFLSPAARDVLTAAAVIGRRFDFTLMQQVLGYAEDDLIPPLKELIAGGLLIEEAPDRLAFRHALAQAALADDLLARERRRLHRRVGELLAATDAVGQAGAAAEHLYAAGVWDQALAYARRAADEALRLYAPHEAIVHLSRALAAARHLEAAPTADLHHLRGQAYETIGELAAAQTDYEAALHAAQAGGQTLDEWQALLDLGFFWLTRDVQRATGYLERMLAVARAIGDPLLLGRSLNRVGNLALNQDDPHTARRYHREALTIFTAAADRRGIAETYDLLAITEYLCGNLAGGTAAFTQAIAGFEALDDRFGLIHSLTHLGLRANLDTERLDVATLEAVEPALARALALATELHWRTGEAFVRTVFGLYLIEVGRYGEAHAMLQAGLQIAGAIAHQWWMVQARAALGLLYNELLAPRRALAQLMPAFAEARASGLTMLIRDVGRYLVGAHVALRAFTPAATTLGESGTPRTIGEASSVPGRQLLRAAAELALARGEAQAALDLADDLIATAAGPDDVIPSLWRLRGTALMQLRRYAEARRALEAAYTTALAQGRRPLAWRIAATLANLALSQQRDAEARAYAEAALAIIGDLAAQIPDRALREPFAQRAAAAVPTVTAQSHRQIVKQAFDGLTDRERAVAQLVARGRTNREIAAELVISERTVTTHLSNILGKLGFSSRTQLARWAIDKGLD